MKIKNKIKKINYKIFENSNFHFLTALSIFKMLSIYLILTKIAVKSVLAEIENASTFGSGQIKTNDQTKPGLGPKKLRIDQKKLEQLHLCQATLEQIMDPSDEEFQKTFDKVCFRKSWKNHMLYLNKVRSSLS